MNYSRNSIPDLTQRKWNGRKFSIRHFDMYFLSFLSYHFIYKPSQNDTCEFEAGVLFILAHRYEEDRGNLLGIIAPFYVVSFRILKTNYWKPNIIKKCSNASAYLLFLSSWKYFADAANPFWKCFMTGSSVKMTKFAWSLTLKMSVVLFLRRGQRFYELPAASTAVCQN